LRRTYTGHLLTAPARRPLPRARPQAFTLSFAVKGDLSALNTFLASRSYIVGCVARVCARVRRARARASLGRARARARARSASAPRAFLLRAPPLSHLSATACLLLPLSFAPTQTDLALHAALGAAPSATQYPNVARYFSHISSFAGKALPAGLASSSGAAAPAAAAAAGKPAGKAAAKATADDDEVDLFGDDGDAAAAKVSAAKAPAAEAAAAPAKKEKAKPIAKSICTYDVKPQDDSIKMGELEAAVRAIKIDGLVWGEKFEVKDVAFGIQKLMVQFVCEDEKVSLDDVEEQMQNIPNPHRLDAEDPDERLMVQSVDQLSMNKLG
jgi:elongation factor 1-beta